VRSKTGPWVATKK